MSSTTGTDHHRDVLEAATDVGQQDRPVVRWMSSAAALARVPPGRRGGTPVRVAVLGTYTTSQLASFLPVAGLPLGLDVAVFEGPYAQVEQQVLDPGSALWDFGPDVVVLAVHAGAAGLPALSDDPDRAVADELDRWVGLWRVITTEHGATVVMHNFATPLVRPLGHLSRAVAGARVTMLHELNSRLARAAGDGVALVDADALSAEVGKRSWFDERFWHHAKQAVATGCVPALARATAAVIASGRRGPRKCLVLDLDDTLWGGTVGEVGAAGVALGGSAVGEAHLAFQEHVLGLRSRGIVLAVCSKNDEAVARSVFEERDDMLLGLDDIAAFVANWRPKSENIRHIAEQLDLGLDAMVFVDDNPAERELVRQHLPAVDVVEMPGDPSMYARALHDYHGFEAGSLTSDDLSRAEQYRARAQARELQSSTPSLADFLASLQMRAVVEPVTDENATRVVQLLNKTNQWNLTTRRRDAVALRSFLSAGAHSVTLRLRDRFGDHGLVAVGLLLPVDDVIEVDTWLMSCRVMGRSVERAMLAAFVEVARASGIERLRGTYLPTDRNGPVADLYAELGFSRIPSEGGGTTWEAPVDELSVDHPHIDLEVAGER